MNKNNSNKALQIIIAGIFVCTMIIAIILKESVTYLAQVPAVTTNSNFSSPPPQVPAVTTNSNFSSPPPRVPAIATESNISSPPPRVPTIATESNVSYLPQASTMAVKPPTHTSIKKSVLPVVEKLQLENTSLTKIPQVNKINTNVYVTKKEYNSLLKEVELLKKERVPPKKRNVMPPKKKEPKTISYMGNGMNVISVLDDAVVYKEVNESLTIVAIGEAYRRYGKLLSVDAKKQTYVTTRGWWSIPNNK